MSPVFQPFVSVLIAARNEEANIIACLQSLSRQHYPAANFEVLIGDDQSTDNTAALVETFIEGKPNFRLMRVEGHMGSARGKGNVLAHLAQEARGDVFLFTDADVVVPSGWISNMTEDWTPEYGVINGITMVQGKSFFAAMQATDWLCAITALKLLQVFGIHVTGLGNNMLVSREAYFAVGGYESLPFSLTEDYALFTAIKKKGYKLGQLITQGALVSTHPMETVAAWFQQRKRWMTGAMQLQKSGILAFFLQFLWYPACFIGSYYYGSWLLEMALYRWVFTTAYALFCVGRLKRWDLVPFALLYEAYFTIMFGSLCIYYFMPGKVEWKGRSYNVAPERAPIPQAMPQPAAQAQPVNTLGGTAS